MKKYQSSLLAGVAALALVAGTGLASAQHTGAGSQAASPQAGQSMSKGSETKGTQTQAQEKSKGTGTQAQEKGKGNETQAQQNGKTGADRTAQSGNMNPGGQGKMGKRGERAERGKNGRQNTAEQQRTLKGLHGDTTKPMQGENEKQEGSKSSTSKSPTKGNTSNQAQEKTPQNNMQRGTESTQRGTESNQRGAETNQRGTETKGTAQTNERGGTEARGGSVQLSEQQRTEIKTTVIQGRDAPRVGHVDFDVRVGTAVPRGTIHVVPVPETLVRIEPRWRGFMYFVYEDEVVIVDPHDYTIVAVVPV